MVREWQRGFADNLAGFMTLAGDEQGVALPEHGDGGADSRTAIADLDRAGRGGEDRRANGGGVFRARIVVGDDDEVRATRCNLAHLRALAGVAIAATTEDNDEPLADEGAQRRQRLLQRVGL